MDNKVEYKANTDHPLFDVLRKVVLKHLGLEDIVETVLERMGNVKEIILVGDYAKGNDSGLIEVFLIGKELNMEYIAQLEEKIENLIGRKVSFYLASKFLADREHIVLFKAARKMISIESEERPWGRFFVLHDEPTYKLKRIEVDPGGSSFLSVSS